jgi:hypothetical protein
MSFPEVASSWDLTRGKVDKMLERALNAAQSVLDGTQNKAKIIDIPISNPHILAPTKLARYLPIIMPIGNSEPTSEEKVVDKFANRLGFSLTDRVPVSIEWTENGDSNPIRQETRRFSSTRFGITLVEVRRFWGDHNGPLQFGDQISRSYSLEHQLVEKAS